MNVRRERQRPRPRGDEEVYFDDPFRQFSVARALKRVTTAAHSSSIEPRRSPSPAPEVSPSTDASPMEERARPPTNALQRRVGELLRGQRPSAGPPRKSGASSSGAASREAAVPPSGSAAAAEVLRGSSKRSAVRPPSPNVEPAGASPMQHAIEELRRIVTLTEEAAAYVRGVKAADNCEPRVVSPQKDTSSNGNGHSVVPADDAGEASDATRQQLGAVLMTMRRRFDGMCRLLQEHQAVIESQHQRIVQEVQRREALEERVAALEASLADSSRRRLVESLVATTQSGRETPVLRDESVISPDGAFYRPAAAETPSRWNKKVVTVPPGLSSGLDERPPLLPPPASQPVNSGRKGGRPQHRWYPSPTKD